MSALLDFQRAFSAGLKGAALPRAFLGAGGAIPLARCFDVYRNNIYASLIEALGQAVPVVRQLVGETFFRAMAREYLRDHLPHERTLIGFGESFPDFLTSFAPAQQLPYLADVARLELAWLQSYHAAPCGVVAPQVLGALAPEDMMRARYELSTSLRLVSSDYVIVSIWQAHQPDGDPASVQPDSGAEHALLLRTRSGVQVHGVDAGTYQFLSSLQSGMAMERAVAASSNDASFDLTAALHLLIQNDAIAAVAVPEKGGNS